MVNIEDKPDSLMSKSHVGAYEIKNPSGFDFAEEQFDMMPNADNAN